MIVIKLAEDFSKTPGARFISDGPFSGELFRETVLIDKYKEAKEKNEKLLIDLDGTYGYATSFLEEAFGGLARHFSEDNIKKILTFKSEDEPPLLKDISDYIDSAKSRR
jgi:hypothetical protein